jgi:flagellar basal-body rod protein FlgC
MNPIASTALSGLMASMARLDASAANVANSETFGPVPTTPPSQPLPPSPGAGPAVYQAVRTTQTTVAGGGVSTSYAPVTPSYVEAYDPSAPFADAGGMVAAPNVDLVTEQMEQIAARTAFEANLKVLKTADEMEQAMLDLKA